MRSEPNYRMVVEPDIRVTMRDGVRIALCVYRPMETAPFRRFSPRRPINTNTTGILRTRSSFGEKLARSNGT